MSVTNQELRDFAYLVVELGDNPAFEAAWQKLEKIMGAETMDNLYDVSTSFNRQDPMRPVESELVYRIANIIEQEYGESNIPHDEALETAERILNNIQLNFKLEDNNE